MTRIKRGTIAHKKREKLLKKVKGFRWGRKSKERAAKEALLHSQSRSFKGRKERKRDFRRVWQVRINAASRQNGISYSRLINKLKTNKVALDRKILSEIAAKYPQVFEEIIKSLS